VGDKTNITKLNIHNWFNNHFPGTLIGRGGHISRLPRSPNLNALDIFPLKKSLYDMEVQDGDNLISCILVAVTDIRGAI
jgi:uncharacterized heparinase superfamily protein